MLKSRLLGTVGIVVVAIGIGGYSHVGAQAVSEREAHVAWVSDALKAMESVKPGMTRADLLRVFDGEGGISSPSRRTFVYRECRMFKVAVEFDLADKSHDRDGRATGKESPRDAITKISQPFIAREALD
jgi:hypothetical protein